MQRCDAAVCDMENSLLCYYFLLVLYEAITTDP
jgi:hypothetical protein